MFSDPSSEGSGGSANIVLIALFTNKQVDYVVGLAGTPSWFNRGIIEIEYFFISNQFTALAIPSFAWSSATKAVS